MMLLAANSKDKNSAEWMYICGGYRMIVPNKPYIEQSVIPKLLNRKLKFLEDSRLRFLLLTLEILL